MLLIDDDEAEVLHGREDAGPRTDNDAGLSSTNAAPLFGSFSVMKRGMKNCDPIAEAMIELAGDRRRQGDLRYQQERVASACECRLDGPQIHLCLAGARDALQQEGFETSQIPLRCGSLETPPPGDDST